MILDAVFKEEGELVADFGNVYTHGEATIVDQEYNPQSANAQSGKAVAEAIASIGNKITKIGEFIEITDISPSEHNVDVKLSSDTTTDFSNVTLFTSGKNLFNLSNFSTDKNYVNVV